MNWSLTICLLTTFQSLTHALNPAILVAGLFNNGLVAKIAENADIDPNCRPEGGGPFRLYLDEFYLLKRGISCCYDGMQLFYDPKTHTTSNRRGVDVKTFMDLNLVDALDVAKNIPIFKPMIEFLEEKFSYKRDFSIFGAAYDFRKGPLEPETLEFCIQFKRLIIKAFTKNGGRKVIIIYHSMGSVIVRHCLRGYTQEFKDKYILVIISLAGVYGGAVKVVDLLTGLRFYGTEFQSDPFNLFTNRNILNRIDPAFLKGVMGTIPTAITSFELLPERTVQNYTGGPWLAPIEEAFGDQLIAQTLSKNYTAGNLREYYLDMGGENLAQIYDDAYDYIVNQPPTGVKMYCLRGDGIPTILTINHMGDTPLSPKSYPTNGYGDGLVNIEGSNCEILKRGAGDKPIETIVFKNHNHGSFVSSKDVLNLIAQIISKETEIKPQNRDWPERS